MKKIMFNDKYGLTKAVLEGKKTQTRRLALRSVKDAQVLDSIEVKPEDKNIIQYVIGKYSRYAVGETLAVAQNYSTIMDYYNSLGHISTRQVSEKELIFWNEMRRMESTGDDSAMRGDDNKMFVRADLMPHQIRITNIRLERLQDISNEDCLKEGIIEDCPGVQYSFPTEIGYCGQYPFETPKAAYAALIDKICGKGTWQKNPWVFVYDFELINHESECGRFHPTIEIVGFPALNS